MKKRLLSVGLMILGLASFSQTYFDEDFEGFTVGQTGPTYTNGWTAATTNPRWTVQASTGANANSTGTGPFFDATSPTVSGGKYLYIETSSGALNDKNTLNSPAISLPMGADSVQLSFSYHMFGATMGTLYVVVDTNSVQDTVATIVGQQQTAGSNPFLVTTTPLYGYGGKSITLKFIGVRGSSYTGDICIDEVLIFRPVSQEIGITKITSPNTQCGLTAAEVVDIEIENYGLNAATGFTASFTVNGGTPVTETVTASIPANGLINYTFTGTANLSAVGPHEIVTYVTLLNDPTSANDTMKKTVTNIPILSTFPYSQGFESGNGGWIAGGSNSSWALGTPANSVINSAAGGVNAYVTNLTGNYNANEESFVNSPCFDFTTLSAPVLSMDVWWNSEFSWDGAVVQSSVDGGATWQKVGAFGDPNNWYNDNSINGLSLGSTTLEPSGQGWTGRTSSSNGSGGWVKAKSNLTGLGSTSGVLLRIAFGSDGSVMDEGFAFDNVQIYDTPALDVELLSINSPIDGCGLTATEVVEVQIVNAGTANVSNFPVSVSVNGGTAITETISSTILPLDTLTYTFTGTVNLSTSGNYSVKAYTGLTGDGLATNDTAIKIVASIPTITTFPYATSFENGNDGWLSSGTSNSWALGTPSATVIDTASNGTKAWVTNLTGNYNNNEQSFVVSPCMDFTNLTSPIISLDIQYLLDNSNDGVVLQSSIDGGATWQKVGAFGNPNNWYTDNTIGGLLPIEPSQEGWTGSAGAASNGWVNARAALSGLSGEPSVRFRIAMGSDGFTTMEGFAFDNLKIQEAPSSDAGVVEIIDPISGCGLSATETVTIRVVNDGAVTINSVPVSVVVNNGTPLTETISTTILPGDTLNYTFTGTINLSTLGSFSIKSYSSLPLDGFSVNDTTIKSVVNIPVISGFPYSQSFESGPAGWTVNGGISSFALGVPAATIIDTASNGTQAWVTNLTGQYSANEAGYVKSPCLDFTSLVSPVISMDVWWNSEFSWDGAVLQSSIDGGTTWQIVGAMGDPNNWYNDNSINGLNAGTTILEPSGQGWTGRTSSTNGSNGWVKATHDLTGLGGLSGVIFRVAFGSDGSVMDEGFAFDNVQIYDKPSQDAELFSIVSPTSGCGLSASEIVEVKVVNAGITSISNFPVSISVNNGTPLTETITATLLPQDTLLYTFTGTVNLSTVGAYNLKAYTALSNDALNSNDTVVRSITNIPVISGFPYSQSFESGNGGWTLDGGTSSFALGAPTGTVINSASNGTQAWVTNLSGNYLGNEAGYVKSPCMDFTTLIAPIISLDVWWNSEFSWDGAVLQSSIDGGTTWQKVGAFGDPNNWYNDNSINGLNAGAPILEPSGEGWTGRTSSTNGSNGWVNATHKLNGLGGQSGVIFRVAFGSDGSVMDEGFAFDNVQIYESPAIDVKAMEVTRPLVGCGLSATEIVAGRFENLGTDTLSNFPVAYSVNGVAITPETFTDTLFPGDKKVYEFTTVANLANPVLYDIKVWSAVVGDALPFNDTASVSFTNFAAETNPYTQTFDLLPDGAFGNYSAIKWTPIDAGTYRWQAETGATGSSGTGPTADHTSGTGTYIYSEASSGILGDTIYLESTCIDITPVNGANSSTRVDYWYHMYGADVVALGLEIDSAGRWIQIDTIIGQQQTANADTFRLRSIDLSAYQGMGVTTFRFWTVKGASFAGDVAIDDFRVYDTVGVNAQMDSIISPMSNCGLSATSTVTVKISNVGLSAISNFPVSYVLNGGTPVVETVTATIIPGTSLNYSFTSTVNLQTVGSYTLEATVSVPGDGNTLNDKVTGNIISGFAQPLNLNFPGYFNGFEGATNNWVTYGTNNSWEIGTPSTFYINKAANGTKAYVTSAASNHNANELSYIETPCFDLTYFTAVDPFDISFQALFKTQSDSDQVWMEMTLNNGATWTKVMQSSFAINFYNNTIDNTWDGFSNAGAGNYIPVLNTLTGIGGNSQVKFRFVFKSNGTNENDGFALDDFKISTIVGLDNQTVGAASFGLHPNPTRDNVTISFNNVETGNYNLTIEDVKGQKVVNEVITVNNSNSTKKVNTSQFEKGVYFVRLVNGSTIVTKKLVVN
jgi:hypothetical protein